MSLQAEANGTRGIDSRRDPLAARGSLNFSARAGRLISYGANLVFSTQQVSFSQSANSGVLNTLNRGSVDFGIGNWAKISGGNIVPKVSKYTLRDVSIRGGFLELTPGPVILTATAGRARDAVNPNSSLAQIVPSYERWIYGGRLGVGQERGTHFHLIGLFGEDDANSITRTEGVQPSQNLNLATNFGFSLFDRAFSLRALGAVSLVTRDTEEEAVDLEDAGVPAFFADLLTVNASTKGSYAGEIDASLRLQMLQLQGGYERIQTGYEAMGLTRPNDDQERIRGQARFRLFERRLSVSGRFTQTRNNLLDLLEATNLRRQYASNVQARLSEVWSTAVSYAASQTKVTADVGSERNLVAHTLTITPAFTFARGEVRHRGSIGGAYGWRTGSTTGAATASAAAGSYRNIGVRGTYGVVFPSRLSLNMNSSLQLAEIAALQNTALQLTLSASRPVLNDKVTINTAAGYTFTENELPRDMGTQTVHRQNLQVRMQWQVPYSGRLAFAVEGLNASSSIAPAYQEVRSRLSYRRRF